MRLYYYQHYHMYNLIHHFTRTAHEKMANSVLAELGRYLNETVDILEDGQRYDTILE